MDMRVKLTDELNSRFRKELCIPLDKGITVRLTDKLIDVLGAQVDTALRRQLADHIVTGDFDV